MNVVFEDAWLVIVDKPAGLPSQPAKGGGDDVHGLLKRRYPYVGLHHRLDTPVSGLLLCTLDPSVNPAMAAAFREHRVERTYLAVAAGEASSGRWSRPVHGEPATTEVAQVARGPGLTALCLRPLTGRKHQLRVHAALAGTPLLGDRTYGEAAGRAWPRLALHATLLELTHPKTGAPLAFRSPLPSDLGELWRRAGAMLWTPPERRGPG